MELLTSLMALAGGVLLRLVLPAAVTITAVHFLRRLDARWQAQGQIRSRVASSAAVGPACWELMGCPDERRLHCPASVSGGPCWQAFRSADGALRESCLVCRIFLQAPIPAVATRSSV